MLKIYQSPNKIPSSKVRDKAAFGASSESALSGNDVALTTNSSSDDFFNDGKETNPSNRDDRRFKLKLESSFKLLTTDKLLELEEREWRIGSELKEIRRCCWKLGFLRVLRRGIEGEIEIAELCILGMIWSRWRSWWSYVGGSAEESGVREEEREREKMNEKRRGFCFLLLVCVFFFFKEMVYFYPN